MGVFQNNLMGAAAAAASAGGGDFYDHQIANSVRWDSGYLKWTPGSAGNRQVWTFSCWVKKAIQPGNTDVMLLNAGTSGSQSSRFRAYWYGDLLRSSSADANYNVSTAAYRDPSAWMHIVWKLTGGTSYQYVNGVEVSTSSVSGDVAINNNVEHTLGIAGDYGTGGRFKGCIAEVVFIDGTAHDPDDFGETKNGVWIPKDPSGLTFGSQGYYLKFESSSDLGNDSSGNNNDWTVVDLAAHDQMLDTPTFNSDSNGGNFCTINPVFRGSETSDAKYGTVTEGNLKLSYSSTSDAYQCCTHKVPASGKWYWEYAIIAGGGSSNFNPGFGIFDPNGEAYASGDGGNKGFVDSIVYNNGDNNVYKARSSTKAYDGSRGSNGDVMGVALDMDNGAIYFSKNGTFYSSGDPTSGASRTNAGATWTPASEFTAGAVPLACCGGGSTPQIVANFGQEGTFGGTETAGGNSDTNGYGNFFSSVPSGYSAICSGALTVADEIDPAQTDDNYPQELFDAQLWTGDGNSGRSITISGAKKPSLSVIKQRNSTNGWNVWTQGYNSGDYDSFGEFNSSSAWNANQGSSGPYTADPTASALTLTAYGQVNGSSNTYVNYRWVGNGGGSSNSDGATSSTVDVAPGGGFSVVTYTGFAGASGTSTVGHGMGVAPNMIIFKSLTRTSAWWTAVPGLLSSQSHFLELNGTGAPTDLSSYGTISAPTTSVFTINGVDGIGGESADYVAFCFANVEGYCKVGSYVGNGDGSNGTFVYTGFRPAWVLTKRLTTNSWRIQDNAMDTYNPAYHVLKPQSNAAQDAYTDGTDYNDFLSNGFKLARGGDTVNFNSDGETYVYLAMAKNPFKYATAR